MDPNPTEGTPTRAVAQEASSNLEPRPRLKAALARNCAEESGFWQNPRAPMFSLWTPNIVGRMGQQGKGSEHRGKREKTSPKFACQRPVRQNRPQKSKAHRPTPAVQMETDRK
ncbi:hypothetical protein TRVL_01086 [Trypanosoma vivax]|nr:hypothetical protein TRVL_01086 [Trypanosoma vivax]